MHADAHARTHTHRCTCTHMHTHECTQWRLNPPTGPDASWFPRTTEAVAGAGQALVAPKAQSVIAGQGANPGRCWPLHQGAHHTLSETSSGVVRVKIPLFQPLKSAVAELGGVISPPLGPMWLSRPEGRDSRGRGRQAEQGINHSCHGLQPGTEPSRTGLSHPGDRSATWPWPT